MEFIFIAVDLSEEYVWLKKQVKMTSKRYIKSVTDLLSTVEPLGHSSQMLFRGQDRDDPLLPKIARKDPTIDTTRQERDMIEELKRRAAQDPILVGKDDWDCLVYAQHYGMATRLLPNMIDILLARNVHLC